jgi:hypothetical protein
MTRLQNGQTFPALDVPAVGGGRVGIQKTDGLTRVEAAPPPCEKAAGTSQPPLDVVDNEVFPMELTHARSVFLLCEIVRLCGVGAR